MSVRNRHTGIAVAGAGLLLATLVPQAGLATASESAGPRHGRHRGEARQRPTRVVQIVLDQLRPEFIDRFNMTNVKRLMRGGASYPNAYLGHMASETVVSHNVMTSGQLPKHMGWSDEWYRDIDGAARAPVDGRYVTGSMSADAVRHPDQRRRLPEARRLPAREVPRHDRRGDRRRRTTPCTPWAARRADMRITFGSRTADCDGVPTSRPT